MSEADTLPSNQTGALLVQAQLWTEALDHLNENSRSQILPNELFNARKITGPLNCNLPHHQLRI